MTNKHLRIGPGGRKCNCCFPAPGSKARRMEYKRAKREEKRVAIKDALSDHNVSDNQNLTLEDQKHSII